MFNIFNMGVGMVLAVAADRADEAMALLSGNDEPAYRIGAVVRKNRGRRGTGLVFLRR